jgi:hypothetical protein
MGGGPPDSLKTVQYILLRRSSSICFEMPEKHG